MKNLSLFCQCIAMAAFLVLTGCTQKPTRGKWSVSKQQYLEKPGLSVLAFHDYYPGGKQGGIEIIQHGERIATNGFIRMQDEGRAFTDPVGATRETDEKKMMIKATVDYRDIDFKYSVRIWPEGDNIRLAVDLDKPIPAGWEKKLTFDMEFYPPLYIGKSFQIGESFGIIPRQLNGSKIRGENGKMEISDMGRGKTLILAGEDPLRKVIISDTRGELVLSDNRNQSYSGWIMVKSAIPAGVTANAIEWTITPNVLPDWTREPMIAISQVGYHPDQAKQAIVELDPQTTGIDNARLYKIEGDAGMKEILSAPLRKWGRFLCYNYSVFDFSTVKEPGMYIVKYGKVSSYPFSIDKNVYRDNVWQPTLEGYFPVQMCHVKVRDRSLIWHGACHLDDALQAPLDYQHVDQYHQYKESETKYPVLTTVPFLNEGGWHDAGDDDLAAGSQATTTYYLVLAYELDGDKTDQTTVSFSDRDVEMYKPDGIPDFVQQIKQGALNLLSGYRAAGHSFAGIIANREGRNITGDWASQTDQLFYDPKLKPGQRTLTRSGINDDRWVFTNKDTGLEYEVAAALTSASRSLKGYDDKLAQECLETARKVWDNETTHEPVSKPAEYIPRNAKVQEIISTAELLYTTGEEKYATHLVSLLPAVQANIAEAAWSVARVADRLKDEEFKSSFRSALVTYKAGLDSTLAETPFGVPWRPKIWGVGWDIQKFAMQQYYLVEKYPDLFDREPVLRVVNYVLGCHPGSNTSLVSGVGAHSVTSAFGVNRTMEYYIPGGMVSGTALIRPDFPEMKEPYPYLWQQTEYVMSGAATYIFCVKAADKLLNM
jgi:endoglucanase